jgi:PAS domain S-box-containing protein
MSYQEEKGRKPVSYQALLDKNHALQDEIENLRARLADAEELGRAISEGDLDALVIPRAEGELIFTLDSADQAYRVLVETMNEGTATFASDGTILYCNRRFAELLRINPQAIVSTSIYRFIAPDSVSKFNALLEHKKDMGEINLRTEGGTSLPVYLSISLLQVSGSPNAWCLVVTDLTEQKKNEEIVAAERLARSIIEQTAEGIVVCDTSGRITHFSNAIVEICECDPTFHRFEDLMDLWFSEGIDAGGSILPVSSALNGSKILGMEAILERKDSRNFHLILNSGPLKNDNGEIIGCVVTLTDITELKLAEENTAKQAQLLNLSYDAIMISDIKGRIAYWNLGAQEIYGYTKEEALGRSPHELLQTEFPQPLEEILKILYRDDRWVGELIHIQKDGRKITVATRWILDRDSQGNPNFILEANSDITERKRAESELAAAHSQIQSIIDNTPDIVYAFNPEERFVLANIAIANLLNSTPDRMIGKRRHEFMSKNDADWHEANDRQVFEVGRVLEFEEYSYLEGRSITWLTKKFPLRDAQGRIYAIAGISADITERKRTEDALREAEETARQRLVEIEDLYHNAPVGLCVLDRELRYIRINEQLAEINGIPAAAHIGKRVRDLMPQLADAVEPGMFRVLETGQPRLGIQVVSETPARPGVKRSWLEQWLPITDAKGQVTGLNIVVEETTERKRREAMREAIASINQIIHSTFDFNEIMREVISEASKEIECETAAISLRKNGRWITSYVHGFPEDIIGREMSDEEEPHAVLAIKTRKPVAINDAFNDERVNRNHMKKWGIRSVLVVPLVTKSKVIGVLFFNYRKSTFEFDDIHVDFATQLASSISMALENSRLYENLKIELTERKQAQLLLKADLEALTQMHELSGKLLGAKGIQPLLQESWTRQLQL